MHPYPPPERPRLALTWPLIPARRSFTERSRAALSVSRSVAMPDMSRYDKADTSITTTGAVPRQSSRRRTDRRSGDESTVTRPATRTTDWLTAWTTWRMISPTSRRVSSTLVFFLHRRNTGLLYRHDRASKMPLRRRCGSVRCRRCRCRVPINSSRAVVKCPNGRHRCHESDQLSASSARLQLASGRRRVLNQRSNSFTAIGFPNLSRTA